MLFHATSSDQLIQISVRNNGGTYHSGAVYWDGNTQRLKVVDGNGNAQDMYGPTVEASGSPILWSVVQWATNKMEQERQLEELCKKFPNLADARREYEFMLNLVKDHNA
jgi:hypothetical protein